MCRTTDTYEGIKTVKFVYIAWAGTGVSPMVRAKTSVHKGMEQFLQCSVIVSIIIIIIITFYVCVCFYVCFIVYISDIRMYVASLFLFLFLFYICCSG